MQVVFKGNISNDEKIAITDWLEKHQPDSPQHLKIDCGEYVVTVVANEDWEVVSYGVNKPESIDIPQY